MQSPNPDSVCFAISPLFAFALIYLCRAPPDFELAMWGAFSNVTNPKVWDCIDTKPESRFKFTTETVWYTTNTNPNNV